MLSTAGSTANVHRRQVTVRTGFRGDTPAEEPSILDRFLRAAKAQRAGDLLSPPYGHNIRCNGQSFVGCPSCQSGRDFQVISSSATP